MSWNKCRNVMVIIILLLFTRSEAQTIRTIAGSGRGDTAMGNGGPATDAAIGQIFGVAIDRRGNVYIADNSYSQVRKVSPSGIITHLAGDPGAYPAFGGDGRPATATTCSLNAPYSLACDRAGNLYIADAGNRRIRIIDTSGVINTFAGIGGSGYFNGDGIAATSAKVGSPAGVEADPSGNIYIGDGNTRARKVNTSGIISTVAGNGNVGYSGNGGPATAASLEGVVSVTRDRNGNLFICDKTNNVIRKVNTSGIISAYTSATSGFTGDGGPVTSARFNGANAVRADRFGNLYIADAGNQRIRRVDTNGIVRTIAGTGTLGYSGDGGPATAAQLANPSDMCLDDYGNIYIADRGNGTTTTAVYGHRIRQIFVVDTFHLAVTPNDTVCGRSRVTFTALPVVPHFNSRFQWFKNGSPVGTDSAVYWNDSLHTGDLVTCTIMDPNYTSMTLAVSDTVRIVITPAVIPHVSIASTGDTLCAGESVTLTASAINAGTAPIYQWQRFGRDIGTTTGPVLTYVPVFGDIITLILHSNAVCAIPDTAMASRVMFVNISYPPEITVDAHPNDTIAFWGQFITLFTETTYGGSAPTFQWYRNGTVIPGATSRDYTEEVYFSDTLYCVMHSNLPCVFPEYDTSNVTYISTGRLAVNNIATELGSLSIVPNPVVSGTFQLAGIDIVNKSTDIRLLVRDINGRTVYEDVIKANSTSAPSVTLPGYLTEGLYYLKIGAGNIEQGLPFLLKR